MVSIPMYILVCVMVFVAGFVDSVAGGGGLITLPIFMLTGLPVHTAIATNKLSAAMGTSASTLKFAKEGFIPLKLSVICIVFALIGSPIGANIALMVSDEKFKIIMLFILPVIAVYVLKSKNMDIQRKQYSEVKTAVISACIAFGVGIYDGFYGPGTGTFLLLLLTGLAHLELNKAAGVTKAINLTTNISALVVFVMNGKVYFPLGLIAGVFGIAGNYIGARCFSSKGSGFVKPLIIVVITIFFIKIITEFI